MTSVCEWNVLDWREVMVCDTIGLAWDENLDTHPWLCHQPQTSQQKARNASNVNGLVKPSPIWCAILMSLMSQMVENPNVWRVETQLELSMGWHYQDPWCQLWKTWGVAVTIWCIHWIDCGVEFPGVMKTFCHARSHTWGLWIAAAQAQFLHHLWRRQLHHPHTVQQCNCSWQMDMDPFLNIWIPCLW